MTLRNRPAPRSRWTLLLVAVCVFGACSSAENDDLAGVERWTVHPEPSVIIGQLEGDPAYLFQQVTGALLTPDGRIVVADRGPGSIRVYDSDGTFVARMGGQGAGPGEFAFLRSIWFVPPDTVGAWDSDNIRVTHFTLDGALARTLALEPSLEAAGVGRLDVLVGPVGAGVVAIGSITAGSADGTGHDRISVERFGPDGEHRGRLTEVTGFIRGRGGPGPFSPYPYFAVHDGVIHFTNGETPTVHLWEGAGPYSGSADRVVTLPPADNDAAEAWEALPALLEDRGDEMRLFFLEQAERSDSIPHLAGLLVDDGGHVWTKRYDAPRDAMMLDGGPRVRGGTWWVADATGSLVAMADVPEGLVPLQVTGDWLLGLTMDEFGVERVQLHTVAR